MIAEASTVTVANPKAAYEARKSQIDAAIETVLASGWYILGREVESFEIEFARYVGVSNCIGVGNGTDALEISLRSCGIGSGDGVITAANTAVATVAAIDLVGARPVLVDVDPASFTLDVDRVRDTVARDHTIRAVIPVHLFGHPAKIDELLEVARIHDLIVIEDCAQAHGALFSGRKVGSFGHAAAFSFYPTKNLGAIGDGGAIVTDDADVARRARELRQYGWRERYISERSGKNSRLDEIQAAILRVKLPFLDEDNDCRRSIAMQYQALAGGGAILPTEAANAHHVYHQYVLRSPARDRLREHLHNQRIGTAILYPVPIHLQRGYADRVIIGAGGLTHTEALAQEILSLPMYPELQTSELDRVIRCARGFSSTR
jgi:dTDP-4-amino-4,6-dideoxygalactose transaminase